MDLQGEVIQVEEELLSIHPARFLKRKFREKIQISWLVLRVKDHQWFHVSFKSLAIIFR